MTNPLYDQLFGRHVGKGNPFLRLADGSVVTYAAFLARAAQMAHVLMQGGLQPGDRLAVQVQKSPEALALYAACVQAGVVFLPLNTAYTTDELSYFIDDSGARMIVCDAKVAGALTPIATRAGSRLETLNADGSGTLTDSARAMPESFQSIARATDDLAALLYTSGTTGRSKGAMLSQGNLLTNAATLAKEWRFTAEVSDVSACGTDLRFS
jgi:malonyl-CoA/methylmalonyl-CoA synthetase